MPAMVARATEATGEAERGKKKKSCWCFQMPLHYPKYTKAEYETMPEWQLDQLLSEYGLPVTGDIMQKRIFAMGAFLWNTSR